MEIIYAHAKYSMILNHSTKSKERMLKNEDSKKE